MHRYPARDEHLRLSGSISHLPYYIVRVLPMCMQSSNRRSRLAGLARRLLTWANLRNWVQ